MSFSILAHTQFLEPSGKSKSKYHCPICNGSNLDISPDGKYQCFSGGCDTQAIASTLMTLAGSPPRNPNKVDEPTRTHWQKPTRPAKVTEFFYPDRTGNPLVKVVRSDLGDGKKSFSQNYWNGEVWRSGCPKDIRSQIPLYRFQEVRGAIEHGQQIFITEGESTVDALWAVGIAATTTIGGTSGYSSYGSYGEDLAGAELILCPDCDRVGIKYTGKFLEDFQTQIKGYCLAGDFADWAKPDGGRDLGDDLAAGLGKCEVLAKVVSVSGFQAITAPKKEPKTAKEGGKPSPLKYSKLALDGVFRDKVRFDASTKQYWRYDNRGKWVLASDEYVFGETQAFLESEIKDFSPGFVDSVIRFAKKDFLNEGWIEASSLLYIPFTNGVLEMATGQLLSHSPDYGFTWQLPREYRDSGGDWLKIKNFLEWMSCGNDELFRILIAYFSAILKGRADLQKFLYLFGSGANGKGTLINLAIALVGKENCHTTTMEELNGNRFESSNLKNKRLTLMTDEDKRSGGFGVFKAATGQDALRDEKKGKDASTFVYSGMFIVAANSPTFVGESNPAIKRRKLDFPCLARMAESDRRDVLPELEAELENFTTYLLGIEDKWVTDTIRGASKIDAVQELAREMAIRENSIAAFYFERLEPEKKAFARCGETYQAYRGFCEESGARPKSMQNFTPDLISVAEGEGVAVLKDRDPSGNIIRGIRLRSTSGEDVF
jgi:P4 family phage/plasmid primase-like protien